MEKKMMIVELILIQDAQWQIGKIRLETFRPHQPRQFDVVEAIVIGHVWRDKLDQSHAEKE